MFGAEARPASPLDLEGLLAGAGQVVRMGGTARVSIVVDARWRAQVLAAECALRGLSTTVEPASVEPASVEPASVEPASAEPASAEPASAEGRLGFRTAYSAALAPLGAAWLRGAVKHPPPDFALDGNRLRLWVVAAGGPDGVRAYSLPLGDEEATWAVVGAALAALGLVAELIGARAGGARAGGAAYRIVGRRRLARLAEIVGEPPRHAPVDAWPG